MGGAPRTAPGHPLVWRGRQRQHEGPTVPSGHAGLDRHLPGGGWPLGALTEIIATRPGLGELSLLLPALAAMADDGGWVILVDPPWTPYPPALKGRGIDPSRLLWVRSGSAAESLWACEQALRGVRGGAVLAWPRDDRGGVGFARLRRLQLAARGDRKAVFLFRPPTVAGQSTPATLRLHLQADEQALNVTILKCRGARPDTPIRLRRQHPASMHGATDSPAIRPPAPYGRDPSSPSPHSRDAEPAGVTRCEPPGRRFEA